MGSALCLLLLSLWSITHAAQHNTNILLRVDTVAHGAAHCSLSSLLLVLHMKLQATFRSQLLGIHSTEVEQDCVVHDSSAQLATAGQLNNGQPGVQGGFIMWSWCHSVQAEEFWYL